MAIPVHSKLLQSGCDNIDTRLELATVQQRLTEQVATLSEQASEALAAGDYDAARLALTEALAGEPDDAALREMLRACSDFVAEELAGRGVAVTVALGAPTSERLVGRERCLAEIGYVGGGRVPTRCAVLAAPDEGEDDRAQE